MRAWRDQWHFFTQAVSTGGTRVLGDRGCSPTLRHVLGGQAFQDCNRPRALRYMHTMRNANQRLTSWALAMQLFNFTIEHRPGVQNGNADGLHGGTTTCTSLLRSRGSVGDSPLQQQGATLSPRSRCLPLSHDITCG